MTISPCAMLMTPMTPKVIARPMAASSSTETWALRHTANSGCSNGRRRPFGNRAFTGSNRPEQRQRILIVHWPYQLDGRDLVGLCRIGVENGGSAGLLHGELDAGIGFGGKSSVQQLDIRCIRRGEHGGRSRQPLCRVLRAKCQPLRSLEPSRGSLVGPGVAPGTTASVSQTTASNWPSAVLDLADQHRLGDVVVGQHLRGHTAGEVLALRRRWRR
jgi:hypothetical protein